MSRDHITLVPEDPQPHKPEIYAGALRRYFSKRVASSDVDDMVQEVYLRIRSRMSIDRIDNMAGYIFTVAANLLREEARRSSRYSDVDIETLAQPDPFTPETIVSARLDVHRLVESIDKLPPKTRDIFIAHRFEEMTYGAIARAMGISISSVEKHIMLALKSLTATLGRTER